MKLLRKPRTNELISPAGAGIVLVCFFLPWLKVSCGTKKMLLRGSDMGGELYVVLGAAILMILAYLVFRILGQTHRSRYFFLAGAIIAAGTIVYKYITVAMNPDIPFYVPGSMVGFELRAGAYGTILGLFISGLGALLLGRGVKKPDKPAKDDP